MVLRSECGGAARFEGGGWWEAADQNHPWPLKRESYFCFRDRIHSLTAEFGEMKRDICQGSVLELECNCIALGFTAVPSFSSYWRRLFSAVHHLLAGLLP